MTIDNNIIVKAMKTEHQINEIQFAKLAGFTDDEIKIMPIFWDPLFNNSWMYLYDKLILEYLTDDRSEHAINNFYSRLLTPNYKNGTDYKQVTRDDPLINGCSKLSSHLNQPQTNGHNKKYFLVTGNCFKHLLMSSKSAKGKESRGYFIKVESLAKLMKDYLLEFSQRELLVLKNNQTLVEAQVKSDTLMEVYNGKRIVYLGFVAKINDQLIVKYGCTKENLRDTLNRHKRTYGKHFHFLYMVEFDRQDTLEQYIQQHSDLQSRHVAEWEGQMRKELLRLDDHFQLFNLITLILKLRQKLVEEQSLTVTTELLLEQEKTKQKALEVELKKIEVELKKVEAEIELKKIDLEMLKLQRGYNNSIEEFEPTEVEYIPTKNVEDLEIERWESRDIDESVEETAEDISENVEEITTPTDNETQLAVVEFHEDEITEQPPINTLAIRVLWTPEEDAFIRKVTKDAKYIKNNKIKWTSIFTDFDDYFRKHGRTLSSLQKRYDRLKNAQKKRTTPTVS
jgi:phage anti-repressor protein